MEQLRNHEVLLVNGVLVISVVVLAIGIWAPLLTLKKLIFVKSTFSVLSGIEQLYLDGDYALFTIVVAFTLVLPGIKIAVLFLVWNGPREMQHGDRILGWLTSVGKWSMLDVFVVAVLIASVKLGAIASIEVHYGLYVFAAAVILIMLNTQFIHRRVRALQG